MGNQGMTNWKFSAFFAIALILVAGMFASTAIAADGDGVVTVQVSTGANNIPAVQPQTADNQLPSGKADNTVQFIYTVSEQNSPSTDNTRVNMDGGVFRLDIHSSWTVATKNITILDDSSVLYDTDADGEVDTEGDTDDDTTRGRVRVSSGAGRVTRVEVDLTSDTAGVTTNWTDGGSITIRFGNVTTPVPSRLSLQNNPPTGAWYEEYKFNASSRRKAAEGSMTPLVVQVSDVNPGANPQPYVNVGNARSSDGTADITVSVSGRTSGTAYRGETDADFKIVYTAPGPMYDSSIRVTLPPALLGANVNETDEFSGRVQYSQRGGVNFDNTTPIDTGTSGQITINIDRMHKGNQVHIFYENITVEDPQPAGQMITVGTDTSGSGTTFTDLNADDQPGTRTGGDVKQANGSGKLVINPPAVQADSRNVTFTFSYTFATKLTDAWLTVALPENNSLFVMDDANVTLAALTEESISGGVRTHGYVPASENGGDDNQTLIEVSGNTVGVKWKIAGEKGAGATVSRRIRQMRLSSDAGVTNWRVYLTSGDPGIVLPVETTLLPVAERSVYVLKATSTPDAPNIRFAIEALDDEAADTQFAAADKATIHFTFRPDTAPSNATPIKNGSVRLRIPNNWTPTNETADADGTVTAFLDKNGDLDVNPEGDRVDLADKTTTPGMEIRVAVDELRRNTSTPHQAIHITYTNGVIQDTRQDEVEIQSWFDAGVVPENRSDSAYVMVTNVADSSGEATIRRDTVDAGSTENEITVRFEAQGSMDGGTVRLDVPPLWGDLQRTDPAVANYVKVSPLSVIRDWSINSDTVFVYLNTFGKGNVLTITFTKFEAQSSLGIAEFIIWSRGSRNTGELKRVKGVVFTDADTRAAAKDIDLIGTVYHATGDVYDTGETDPQVLDNDGLLRVAVAGGGDGAGTVTRTIVSSEEGTALYTNVVQVDGSVTASTTAQQVHAGDAETHLQFVYTPVETITDGELRFTVDPDWSSPQANSSSEPGYTTVSSSGGGIGSVEFNTASGYLTVPIHSLDKSSTITVDYGTGSGGAEAPDSAETSTFIFAIRGSDTELGGVLKSLTTKQPQIIVRPQASGRGSVSIDTGGDVHAGQEGRTVTITYSPEGQVVNGRLKVGVPADWSDALAANFNISPGTPKFGGPLTADQLAEDDDLGSVDELVVSSINLRATQNLVLTFMTDIQPTAGTAPFTFAFDGSHGPDEGFLGLANQEVEVMEAKAGSGEAMIAQMGKIVVGDTVEAIAITYTAEGQIKGTIPGITDTDRLLKIRVPTADGWSAPSGTANAAGYYTVILEKPDEDADDGYSEITGSIEAMDPMKANADDEETTYIVVRVLPEKTVEKGQRITISYTNAVAPDEPGNSAFVVFFDDGEVDSPNVLVQSAEGATQLVLSSDADSFIIDDGGSLDITVKLVGPDGTSPATSDEATTVTLSADGGTIASSVTIDAGEYEGVATLTADDPGSITITAAAAATGLEGDELMVMADTDNVMIDEPISVSPMYVAASTEGTPVTVMATGTAAQDGKFSVSGGIATEDGLTEDEAGSYSGTFLIFDLITDGIYEVTVSLNGKTSEPATFTVDSTAPTVSASASAEMVAGGDMVTISAMAADDGSGVTSVMADVSMLDSTQGMVALTMGDDGAYSADVTISERSEGNEADNGAKAVTVTATDMAGNIEMSEPVMVTLQNEISYTSTIPVGISLFHVPLMVEGLDTVGDLRTELGDKVNSLVAYHEGRLEPESDNIPITAGLGIIVILKSEATVTFTGEPWGDDGTAEISLKAGSDNLIGLPLDIEGIDKISDIIGLDAAIEGVYPNLTDFVAAAGDTGDGDVTGDAAYYVVASAAATITVTGEGWSDSTEMVGAAPIALSGYKVDNQTPVLSVFGSVVDEITGVAKEGFRVKVKNLSTKGVVSEITSIETADGYSMTLLDLANAYAARVGDVLEISADSPNPLIGVKPVRHIVTVDDVKNSTIQLEELIAYEIPAETELLRNYPNPFNPETWIPYRLAEDADVSLTIYDAYGSLVRSVDIGHQIAAVYDTRAKAIYWDGRNQFGEQVASGLYFYHLSAGDFSGTRRMVILK